MSFAQERAASLADFMSQNNVSVISALLHKYPELGEYQSYKPVPNDELIRMHLVRSSTPPLKALEHVEKALGCSRVFIQRLLIGESSDRAEHYAVKKEAKAGGVDVVRERVRALDEHVEGCYSPLTPSGYHISAISAFSSCLGLPNAEPAERISKFKTDRGLCSIGLAWLLFDVTSECATPETGAKVFIRRMMHTEFGEKHKVLVTFVDSHEVVVSWGGSYPLAVELPRTFTPNDVFNSDIMAQVEAVLDVDFVLQGYDGYRAYLRLCAENEVSIKDARRTKRAFYKERAASGLYQAAQLEHTPKEVSDILSVLNRYVKNRKLVTYKLKSAVYSAKSELLIAAVKVGDAKVAKLLKRKNPYLLNDGDIAPVKKIVRAVESVAMLEFNAPPSALRSIVELYRHLESSDVAAIGEDGKIIKMVDESVYQSEIIDYIASLSSSSMVAGLRKLFLNSYAIYGCFNQEILKDKRWSRNESYRLSKFFNENYADVWEIEFGEHVFHIPYLSAAEWREQGVEETEIPYAPIGSSYVSPELEEKYPLERCLKMMGIFIKEN